MYIFQILDLSELKKCRKWKLVDLKLTGNNLVTKFSDAATYQGYAKQQQQLQLLLPKRRWMSIQRSKKVFNSGWEREGRASWI